MAFDVAADAYDRFMGRFSRPLGPVFADAVGVRQGQRALDVGCGPGALTELLVSRCGAEAVAAVDPSDSFVVAARERLPGVDVRTGAAEALPFEDDAFDTVLAQLVVHFMSDPVAGLTEMRRVCRPGGRVAACVWDLTAGHGPLAPFWRALRDVDPGAQDGSERPGGSQEQLLALFRSAGLADLAPHELWVTVWFASFEDWWDPFLLGVGPAGDHVRGLDEEHRAVLRDRCRDLLPAAPFELRARAFSVVGGA